MNHIRFYGFDDRNKFASDQSVLDRLIADAGITPTQRAEITEAATTLITRLRRETRPSLMEQFLGEYGLSTQEGVALMCLAEAMLRVPDTYTMDALIDDKIAPSEWGAHLGQASSTLVNASTWALMLTGRILDDDQPGLAGTLRGAIKRLGEPVIRTAVSRAMKEMGRQFVLGESIQAAMKRAAGMEARGYTYSYDMLGEAARTAEDAARYATEYAAAITQIGAGPHTGGIADRPGISVKLSALHPRYEVAQETRVMDELVPVVTRLARQARDVGIGFHIDAEEQDRLGLSLRVIDRVLADSYLDGWDGFGVVVQAYGKRAPEAIDALYQMAATYDRRMNIRLVKGAYWDTEMKLAQVAGLSGFTLYQTKAGTDVAYICLAERLFRMGDRLFPQFATHNAHTVAAILNLADGRPFEFQRLHGMGEALHDMVLREHGNRCRIYAPVGQHRDLLAYLVRRLLENGANSSFVHQIVDKAVPASEIAADPFAALTTAAAPAGLVSPADLFGAGRKNARGFDLNSREALAKIDAARDVAIPDAHPIVVGTATGAVHPVANPATGEVIAQVTHADLNTVRAAMDAATPWAADAAARAETLRRAADLYEEQFGPFFAVLAREAGKTQLDAVGELREAVDFLRYYADQGEQVTGTARGIVSAISPWNFPLAIFTGQIAAALMAGNAVLAKPAEQTPITAFMAVKLLHQAGVPMSALQFLPGAGAEVGAAVTSDSRVNGVVFTGSTATAQRINRTMAEHAAPGTPLIAETGGLNAMVVDSTALPEQAVRDIVASAFQSAGQRCSALRCLYVQEDTADQVIEMIKGAMDQLTVGDPWDLSTDVGPVIDGAARDDIAAYIEHHRARVLHQLSAPVRGTFVPPTLIAVNGIADLTHEVFGPVLHVATFKARDLDRVIDDINARGFGLTFGLHTRIDERVQRISSRIHVGNTYVNRNQIGAVVGSQPFGGEGLSGTGPKAGGPYYLPRFMVNATGPAPVMEQLMPGPTGEMNRLTLHPRGPILCLGPTAEQAAEQARLVRDLGGVAVTTGEPRDAAAVLWWGDAEAARTIAKQLAAQDGAIIPLITERPDAAHVLHERHLCVDTTAAGGNAALLAG